LAPEIGFVYSRHKGIKVMDNNKNDFQVYALEVVDKDTTGYVHWAEGLTLYIVKDGVTMKLNSEEIKQVVKALPETVGGRY
jgi:Ca2+-binding EF-hand superfamily protein